MRHFQPFLCQWCPPQCQTCHICQNLSKMKVQHLENKCQNWSKLGAYLKTDKSIPVYFQSSISKAKKTLPINLNLKCKMSVSFFDTVCRPFKVWKRKDYCALFVFPQEFLSDYIQSTRYNYTYKFEKLKTQAIQWNLRFMANCMNQNALMQSP